MLRHRFKIPNSRCQSCSWSRPLLGYSSLNSDQLVPKFNTQYEFPPWFHQCCHNDKMNQDNFNSIMPFYFSQNSNMLNASRLKVLKAREDHINVSIYRLYSNLLWPVMWPHCTVVKWHLVIQATRKSDGEDVFCHFGILFGANLSI